MINLQRLFPPTLRKCIFAAFLITGPAVAMNAYLDTKLNNMRIVNTGLSDTYFAWEKSETKDMAQLTPLFEQAKGGNAIALALLSLVQHRADPPPSLDEALIGFYRTAPDYMLVSILYLENLYNPDKREPGEVINTALSTDQARSLTECASRLRSSTGRYEHLVNTHDDRSLSFWIKQQAALANVMLDELGIRQSTCNDLQV